VIWGLTSGDSLRASQIVGLALALSGAALAARSSQPSEHATAGYRDPRGCIMWAAGSAVAFGVFLTALPKAAAHGRAWALLDARLALIALMILWAGRGVSAIKLGRTSLLLTIPGLLLVLGTLLYTTAADHGDLSLVSVLGSMFPVVTVGLGIALLQERLSRIQAIGVAAALTGIVLIAL
jgi:drug/metabolite transporter (DMT)-like permease